MTWMEIAPEDVARMISFEIRPDAGISNWMYDPSDRSIANLQAEGVSGVTTILARESDGVAILADEVGMGKTVQAFGVMALLWRRKPDAKVLVVVPKSHLVSQWTNEYELFQKRIVRGAHEFPDPLDAGTLNKVVELRNEAAEGKPLFILTRLSVFSNLTKGSEVPGTKSEQARFIARELRERCGEFDLLVFDEAHYLRTKEGGSQRVAAVDAFLGRDEQNRDAPIASKVLLMTGTPNHSSNDDVRFVLKYFVTEGSELMRMKPAEILSRIAVRRLRKLAGKAKYQYREESEVACRFPKDDPGAEVYFALYQRGLAHLEAKDGGLAHRHDQRRFLYGYLEGFESLSVIAVDDKTSDPSKADDRELRDYHRADDTDILRDLAGLWNGAIPDHPKYDGSLSGIVPERNYWDGDPRSIEADKHLVFVRRIPSCHEMVTRVNERYDRLLLGKILQAAGRPDPNRDIDVLVSRKGVDFRLLLDEILKDQTSNDPNTTDATDGDGEDRDVVTDRVVPSRVMDYFRTHFKSADTRNRYTAGSRFRKRFESTNSDFKGFFGVPEAVAKGAIADQPCTFGDIYWMSIQGDNARICEWKSLVDWCGAIGGNEAFFERFLRKGILLASPGVVELFSWFLGREWGTGYAEYCRKVADNFAGSVCQRITARAIACYREFVTKFVSQTDSTITKHEWNHLNALDPAEFCSGEVTGVGARERLIHSFNSPFFPNVLVATSVFQEGVNLHYHCRKVVHYGIAWTTGDNEQRVGRVDRLQGAVERSIVDPSSKEGHLKVLYPYLEGTFDEQQLGQFIERKKSAEDVLDRGEVLRPDKHIDASQAQSDWKGCLRKPRDEENYGVRDPYPWPRCP